MSVYPPKINARFAAPENAGKLLDANVAGTNATFVCGAVLRIELRIEAGIIFGAKFQTDGCGYLIAAADILTESIKGKKLAAPGDLRKQNLHAQIENQLGAFGEHRSHCLELCLESLQNALANFRTSQVEEWTGEKALICSCFGVSEDKIDKLVKENLLTTVEEVTEICNAGGGCGSCQFLIQEILDVSWQER